MKNFIFIILTVSLFAQDNLKVKRVDIFKNGTAFFTSEGTVKLNKGEGVISPIPQAAFGTIWVGTADKIQIQSLLSADNKESNKRTPKNFYEALRANIGRKISLRGSDEKSTSVTGILQSVEGTTEYPLLTIKDGAQTILTSASWYTARIEFPDGFNAMYDDSVSKNTLKIITNSQAAGANFQMVYFQTQLGWSPAYRIDLLNEKSAQIILSATVVNDIQDLEKANVNLVVGFPSFKYSGVQSPLTSSASLQDFLRQLTGDYNNSYQYQNFNNNIAAQSVGFLRGGRAEEDAPSYTAFTAVDGQAEEDLFFYNLNEVTLKKGDRALYSLFTATVPYQHIYEVALPNGLNIQNDYLYDKPQDKKEPHQVWHSIKLENKSTNPWTTGAAMTLQNGRALGQDVLRYTAVGANSTVRLTLSPDIHVTDEEKESDRKENVKKKDSYYYDQVTVTGEITIHNYKDKPITLNMTRPVTGKVTQSSDKPKITQQARINSAVNQENLIEWDIPLKAREEKKVTYQYEVFLRR